MPSLEPRMNDLQHSLVKSALQIAFEKGRHFSSADAVDDYLKEAGVSVQLLAKHGREIFNCYLSLQAELQGRRQPLSPPLSVEGSQLNAPDGPIERDNCSDQSDTVAPTFDSHKLFVISFFRPRFNEFDLLTAKNCKGNVSYISEKTVRKHHLRKGARSTILTWRYTGGPQSNEKYKTRCEVVRPELLPDCDIAFAEECGMQDSESSGEDEEDDEDSTESVNRPQRNDIVLYQSLEATTLDDLSPEQEQQMLRRTAILNFETSMFITKRKAQPPPCNPDSTSYPTETQRKRPRRI